MKYLIKYEKFYVTHDNGGRPFSVKHDNKKLYIYKNIEYLYDVKDIMSGEKDSSVLIALKEKNKYVFVGTRVFEFTTETPIKKYVGKIGNNDVPYPYAICDNYIYILLDKVYFDKKMFDESDEEDVYNYYYENQDDIKTKKLDNLKIIEKRNI